VCIFFMSMTLLVLVVLSVDLATHDKFNLGVTFDIELC
jgi:hypothetical protein